MVKLASETEATLASYYEAAQSKGAPELRAAAWAAFAATGLPGRRVEAWRYTDLKAALARPAPIAAASRASVALPRAHDAVRLVTLDGAFRPDLSDLNRLPEGVLAQSLREALAQGDAETMRALASADVGADDAMLALNAALMQDGVVLRVARGVAVPGAIELASYFSTEAAQSTYTRVLVVVGAGARATFIETLGCLSSAPAQDNLALVLRLGADAAVDLVTHVSGAAADSVRVMSLLTHLAEDASLRSDALIEGGGLLRRQIYARLDGLRAKATFNGATLARGRNHVDTTLIVDHAKPDGQSRERFRNILDERSVGVFQGKIIVRRHAQRTDGVMESKALLLSDGATMNNKPELEIFADDVRCGHGATCGRLDADQLFYLMARGLPRREAEALLVEGFAAEAFGGVADENLSAFLRERIGLWLSRRVA